MTRYHADTFRKHLKFLEPFRPEDWTVIDPVVLPPPKPGFWPSSEPGPRVSLCHRPSGCGLVLVPCCSDDPFDRVRTFKNALPDRWRVWFVDKIQKPCVGYVRDLWTLPQRSRDESAMKALDRSFGVVAHSAQQAFSDRIIARCLQEGFAPGPVVLSFEGQSLYINDLKHYKQLRLRIDTRTLPTGMHLRDLGETTSSGPYPRRWYLSSGQALWAVIPDSAHAQLALRRSLMSRT